MVITKRQSLSQRGAEGTRGVGVWVRCCMCIYVSEYDIYISGTQGASAGGKLAPCGLLSVRPGMPAHFVDVHVYVHM